MTGKTFTALLGSTPISGTYQGDVEESGDEQDATDNTTGTYQDTEVGTTGLAVSITGNHRSAASPWPGIAVGSILTNVKIAPHGIGSTGWILASAIVVTSSEKVEKRGKITFTARIKSKGAYTRGTIT